MVAGRLERLTHGVALAAKRRVARHLAHRGSTGAHRSEARRLHIVVYRSFGHRHSPEIVVIGPWGRADPLLVDPFNWAKIPREASRVGDAVQRLRPGGWPGRVFGGRSATTPGEFGLQFPGRLPAVESALS